METTEDIKSLNNQLKDLYGIDTVTGQVMWRIVWSEDEFEKRYGTFRDFTREGIFLREVSEVREVPKYKYTVEQPCFILEHLTLVPPTQWAELGGAKISYEPVYSFHDAFNNPLPPRLDACQFVIEHVIEKIHNARHGIHQIPDKPPTSEEEMVAQQQKIDSLVEELFGDQSNFAGGFAAGDTVAMPTNYTKRES